MAELKQGCTLKNGKYKVVKTLGQGSFGITYLATTRVSMDGQLGKLDVDVNVTIKEFFMCDYSSRAVDGISVERTNSSLVKNYQNKFQREAINLSKLHHPNIVKVLEVFDENNTTYYVMEFIDGVTVDDYIKKEGKLSAEESLKITKEVCFALAYMHRHNMLHLDLKPKNIMRNNEGHIFLIDFGLAKQYKENGEPESSTTIGLGTLGYAPKVGSGEGGTVAAYQLFRYEVTNEIWKTIMGDYPAEDNNKPVNVSYEDCLVFIKKLNELSDKKYRLPTIAEWLLAVKPDSGNKISKLGWFRESGHSLHDVGLKAPNSYGLYDMLGNVHEWCQERFNINNSETQVSSSINGHFAAECGGHFDAHVNSFPYFSGAEIDAVGNCNSVTGFRIARDIN